MDIEQQTDPSFPFMPSSPLMGTPSIPDLTPSQPQLVQVAPDQPAAPDTSHNDVFRQVAKALMGHETSYSVDDNGNTIATESATRPGHFFRNVVTAALLGGAAGANGNSAQGFFGGLARGGAAAVNDARQQDLLKRQQAEQDFQNNQRSQQMQMEKNRDQREQDAFATQETLRKAQVAQANAETYRLNMLTQGADYDQHQKLAEQGKQHFADFDAAGLSPVFKGVPEAEMQDLIQNRPGASTFDWEATGVKLGTGSDGKPTYQYTYSAYDPKGQVPVSAGTIAQWKRDGMDKYYPELFGILKPGKEVDATHYIELKRLDSKLFGDNLVRQKADQETAEGQARIHLQNAQAANAMAESYKARLEGEVIKEGKNQQQATSLALSRLNDVNGDISKLAPKDRVLIGESANRMLATMGSEVSALLHAGDSDSLDQAHAIMGEMDSVRRLALSPLIAGSAQASGGNDPRVAAAVAHLKGKSPEEVEQALSDPRIPEASKSAISGSGNGTFTDTLGVTALTVSGGNPVNFTYPVTEQANGATTATASLSYQTYTVRTNFGCSGIVEYGSTSVALPYRLTLADGSYYEFSYEGTYQATDGAVTGRLASLRLPTGGLIQYGYFNGCNGSGMTSDGTVGALIRTTSDGYRVYGRGVLSGNSMETDVQDEKGNLTRLFFTIDPGTQNFYETHRTTHQGNLSQATLLDVTTCYNGAAAPCDSTAITLPISEVDTTTSYNGGSPVTTKNSYDPNGTLLTQSDTYDGTTILNRIQTSYNALGEPLSVTKYDVSGNPYASTTYGYDEAGLIATSGLPQHTSASGQRGNLTSVHVTGSPNINTSTTYYDTGMPATTTAADGGQTVFTYDGTGAFVTNSALPTPSSGVPLSTSATYDAYSASLLSSTGMNPGETTTILSYEPTMAPKSVQLPSSSVITVNRDSATQITATQTLDSSRTASTKTILDGYGRLSRSSIWNGQSSNAWYNTDYCYDSVGLLAFQSVAYAASSYDSASVPLHCSSGYPGTAYNYDALGRMLTKTTSNGTASWQYNNRAVKSVNASGVGKITQYDALGQLSSVCELSTSVLVGGSPTDCGSNIAGTGFLTTYSYSLANHVTQINQGGQLRTFVTDAAGRTVSVTEPESGVTSYSYSYNANGLAVIRTRPKENQTNGAVTNTATQYDRMGREVSVSYDDGITPAKYFYYDVTPSLGWSTTPTNIIGRLVATQTSSGTRSQYTYDVAGNVRKLWQCAPSICGTSSQEGRPALEFTYDLAGSLMSEADGASGSILYGRSVTEQIVSVTNQNYNDGYNPPNLVTDVVQGPFGPNSWNLGNGLAETLTYDDRGRNTGHYVCPSASNGINCNGELYGNAIGFSGNNVTWICDTAIGQCQNNSYDEFGRLSSVSGNSSFGWSYDRWGNRLSQAGSPSVSYSFNSANNQNTSFSYDAAGNQSNDAVHNCTYDAEGKVLAVDGGWTAQYTYDALDHRIRVQTSGSTYEYLFDAFGRRMSSWLLNGSGAGQGNEGRIYWDYGLLANRAWNGQTYFHHSDWLGTERFRTNYQGTEGNKQASNAFGDGLTQTSSDIYGGAQDNNQFTSQEQDAETGTVHFQYRQYSSTQGRWMSPDPYLGSYDRKNPQSLNRYAYALNNPFSFVDPIGLAATWCYSSDDWDWCEENGGDGSSSGGGGSSGGGDNCPPGMACIVPAPPQPPEPPPSDPGPCWIEVCGYNPNPPANPIQNEPSTDPTQNAPNNGKPTRGQCASKALKSDGNGVSLALDVAGVGAGFLPGGGLVTGSARAASFAFGAQVGLTAASTGASIAYKSGPGIIAGILGGQVALTAKSAEALAVDVGRSIPIVGVAVSTGALLYDGYQTYQAYSGCLAGVHE